MAKADLKKVQKAAAWADDAADCQVAIKLSLLTNKEAAARLGLSEQQLSNQLAGTERPQTELWRADEVIGTHYVTAHALRRPKRFRVKTTITVIQRTA